MLTFLKEMLFGFVFTLLALLVLFSIGSVIKWLVLYDVRLFYVLLIMIISWAVGYALTY